MRLPLCVQVQFLYAAVPQVVLARFAAALAVRVRHLDPPPAVSPAVLISPPLSAALVLPAPVRTVTAGATVHAPALTSARVRRSLLSTSST